MENNGPAPSFTDEIMQWQFKKVLAERYDSDIMKMKVKPDDRMGVGAEDHLIELQVKKLSEEFEPSGRGEHQSVEDHRAMDRGRRGQRKRQIEQIVQETR